MTRENYPDDGQIQWTVNVLTATRKKEEKLNEERRIRAWKRSLRRSATPNATKEEREVLKRIIRKGRPPPIVAVRQAGQGEG